MTAWYSVLSKDFCAAERRVIESLSQQFFSHGSILEKIAVLNGFKNLIHRNPL
jgi:hypothetical protein